MGDNVRVRVPRAAQAEFSSIGSSSGSGDGGDGGGDGGSEAYENKQTGDALVRCL